MSNRITRLQLVFVLLILTVGVGALPTDEMYPSSDLTVTIEGRLVSHKGVAVKTGQIVAFPITYNSLGNGYLASAIRSDGRYQLEVTKDVSYRLVFFEYTPSNTTGNTTVSRLVHDRIPDIHMIGVIDAQSNMTVNTTRLPKGHPVRIHLTIANRSDSNGEVDVQIADVVDNDTGAGFNNQRVDAAGYVRFSATDRRTIELAGRIAIEINVTRGPSVTEYFTINDSRGLNITVQAS